MSDEPNNLQQRAAERAEEVLGGSESGPTGSAPEDRQVEAAAPPEVTSQPAVPEPDVPEPDVPEPSVVESEAPATDAPPVPEVKTPEEELPAVKATEQTAAPPEPPQAESPAVEPPQAETPPVEPPQVEAPPEAEAPKSDKMDWYILKVQSNREDGIREALLRRVKIAGLEEFFGDVIVPVEKVTEVKAGKKRVTKRKLYPGYLVVHMEINDDTWFLVRETPGIGDFTGAAGRPSPMLPHEVARILAKEEEKSEKAPTLKIGFRPGDQVKINEGTFENFEGEVESIDQTNGRVTVMINIFGRSTPVELEYWQIGAV